MTKIKAVGYVRVSTDDQQLSPIAQRDLIESWAHMNGLELVTIHEDAGVSGGTPWLERPGLLEAVHSVKKSGASWLVVARMDRLSRDLYNQLHLGRHLEPLGARLISCTEAPEATNTPEKQLMSNMVGAFAEYERALLRSRTKAALEVRKKQGIRLGPPPLESTEYGRCVLWYIWYLRDLGYGVDRIVKTMNEQGVRGPRGGRMHARNVQRILKKDRPTEEPRGWNGPKYTWRSFENGTRRLRRNRHDSPTTGRPSPSGGSEARDAAIANQE